MNWQHLTLLLFLLFTASPMAAAEFEGEGVDENESWDEEEPEPLPVCGDGVCHPDHVGVCPEDCGGPGLQQGADTSPQDTDSQSGAAATDDPRDSDEADYSLVFLLIGVSLGLTLLLVGGFFGFQYVTRQNQQASYEQQQDSNRSQQPAQEQQPRGQQPQERQPRETDNTYNTSPRTNNRRETGR